MQLDDLVTTIPLIGNKYAEALKVLDIYTIQDLLFHIPSRYEDTSKLVKLSEFSREEKKTALVSVIDIKNIRLRSRKKLQKGIVSDGYDQVEVVWFNQPYLINTLKPDSQILISGKLSSKSIKPQLNSPEYELLREEEQNIHLGRIVPIYKLTKGISKKWLRSRLNYLIANIDKITDLKDTLNEKLKLKYQLIDTLNAFSLIHFPENSFDIEKSRERLGFDELLEIQMKVLDEKEHRLKLYNSEVSIDNSIINEFISNLPFKLTPSQITAYKEIYSDYAKPYPMKRLLQGDVGSGKTVLAALAAIPIIENSYQVAILAPTSVLAKQHFDSFTKFFPKKNIALNTSSSKTSTKDKRKIDIIIGTHALLHSPDNWKQDLNLVVVDEQHRFGVAQRRLLINLEEGNVNILHLTATPIPRTMALSLFGDYDVSKIKKPTGRKLIETFLVPNNKRTESYKWIKEIASDGGQIFWVYPLIEENIDLSVESILEAEPKLRKIFPNLSIEILHGKMKPLEKESILQRFKNKKVQILISTTVIEVGIDIPDANLIIIESAERFGLAQLHQLRGRVGRGDQKAWCLLYTNLENNTDIIHRLNYFAQEDDGIKISEYDLERRGPGEVYGTIQSGLPQLKVANFSNTELLKKTRECAEHLRLELKYT